MYANLNGLTVLSGTVTLPRFGAWHAELIVDADAPPTGVLTLTLGTDPAVTFVGSTLRAGPYAAMSYLKIVGGKGGLSKTVGAIQYVGVPASVPVTATIAEVGEVVGVVTSPGSYTSWSRAAVTAGAALTALADDQGLGWRVLADGTIFFAAEGWPDSGLSPDAFVQTDLDPGQGWVQLAIEAPTLAPGTTLAGRQVSRVRHDLTPGSIRTSAWLEDLVAA